MIIKQKLKNYYCFWQQLSIAIFYLIFFQLNLNISRAENINSSEFYSFLGPKVNLKTTWVGKEEVSIKIPILVLAGHADSQGIAGAGTAGEAVDIKGAIPMDDKISDELFWNLLIRDSIVKEGLERGLNIKSYEPPLRDIIDGNDPRTNWSVGAEFIKKGGYVFEIHFDSYQEHGFGSGLIPSLSTDLNLIDENLAKSFGRYPLFFRGGLGAPRRGIRILEIGKLEGNLEKSLRDINSREEYIQMISKKVVNAIVMGASLRN
tara:strand:- start:2561 stop:3346 length:786 start_codon:yes stop_codon:yes gene_type:complete